MDDYAAFGVIFVIADLSLAFSNRRVGRPNPRYSLIMKTILMTVLLACALFAGACSRSDKQPETAAQTTRNFQSDAERLRQATAKAAEARKNSEALIKGSTPDATRPASPTPSVPQS